jgi:hypothetical protein
VGNTDPKGWTTRRRQSELDVELTSSEATVLEIKRLLNKEKFLDDERTTVVAALIHQAIEHHAAILLLLRSELVGSAFALTTSVTEILYRGVWLNTCATDAEVNKFAGSDKLELTVGEMAKAIDAACGLDFFVEFKNQTWKALNSYAHTGMLQVGRRFTGDILTPSYANREKIEVLRAIRSCIVLLVRPFFAKHGHLDSAKEIDKLMVKR